MATPAQLSANRANALKSTGPHTPEGKAASSVNHRKHGFRGSFFLAPAESAEEWELLQSEYVAEWQPDTETERNLVQMLAENFWLRKRAQMRSMAVEGMTDLPLEVQCKHMEMYMKYSDKFERAFHKCLKQLQTIRKEKEKQRIGFERAEAKKREEVRKEVLHDWKVLTAEAKLEKLTEPKKDVLRAEPGSLQSTQSGSNVQKGSSVA